MRIDRIFIDGFGHFHQEDIEVIGPLTVISGANEAGKSTILEFVRTVLFGFPRRGAKYFYRPLAGGAHGGRVTLTTDDGQKYTVQRYQGPRGGAVKVTGTNGALADESILASLVGPSADLFKSVFAFSLDELQDMNSLRREEISDRIYSAGVGATNLPTAVRDLDSRLRAIFSPSGRNHEVASTLKDLEGVEVALSNLAGQASEYGLLTDREEAVLGELAVIAGESADLSSKVKNLDRLSKALKEWTSIKAREERLGELPQFKKFPEDAVVRLKGLDDRVAEVALQVEDAEEALHEAETEAETEVPDEDLIPEGMEIESILRGRSSFDASVRDLPDRRAELGAFKEKLARDLRDLGPEWDEAMLQTFEASVGVRNEAEQWRERLMIADQTVRDRKGELLQAQRLKQDTVEARDQADEALKGMELPALDSGQIQDRRRKLRSARSALADLLPTRQRVKDLERQLQGVSRGTPDVKMVASRIPILPFLLVAGGLVAIMLGFALDGQQAALILGVVLMIASPVVYLQSRSGPQIGVTGYVALLRSQLSEAQAQDRLAETALWTAGESLGTNEIDPQVLDDIEENLATIQETIRRHEEAAGGLVNATRILERDAIRKTEAEGLLKDATTEYESATGGWRKWLSYRGLSETLTPNAFIDLLGRVEAARVQSEQVTQMRERIKKMKRNISEYHGQVESVAGRHDMSLDDADVWEVATVADDLIKRLDGARKADQARQIARETAKKAQRTFEKETGRLARQKEDRQKLICLGGAEDAEDLLLRASQHQQRRDLERQNTEDRERLRKFCLSGQSLQELVDSLTHMNSDGLSHELTAADQELKTLDDKRQTLAEERGKLTSELERLATDDAASELRSRKDTLLEHLKVQAVQWSKLAIASAILQRTRQKYEQERQPGVVRHAQEFFETITDGRYARVYVPTDTPEQMLIETTTGDTREPGQLSRGTREQLYLALRFGLVREFGERAESLPVIVDEVLVNFDPDRARRAAETFAKLSLSNQVLVFTCQPSMVAAFTTACPDTHIIELPSG